MLNKTLQLESFGITDIGLVREHNEDVWAAHVEEGLFILADGMGGHSAGEIASKEATRFLYDLFKEWKGPPPSDDEAEAFFKDAYHRVNTVIYEKGLQNEELKGMGTTLCSLFFYNQSALIAHVGDSRIYRFRKNRLQQLTEDHSLVSELLSLGAMNAAEAETFPYKHILTRAIGTQPRVESTVESTSALPHDTFILCSDGLTNYVTYEQLEKVLKENTPLARKGQTLVDLAMEQGGGDNVTLILITIL